MGDLKFTVQIHRQRSVHIACGLLAPDQSTIEPSGTAAGNAKSNTQLTVTIKDTRTDLPPDKAVQIRLIAHKPTQGGHDHDDPTRPRGSLANQPCASDEPCHTINLGAGTGSTSVHFDAPIVSGTHTFTAQCDKCQGDATATLDVKVEGLETIPASAFYVFIGGEADKPHHDNHYLTPDAAAVLWNLALNYQVEPQFKTRNPATQVLTNPPLLHVNDASLVWGGRFDTKANWTNPHWEHMRGTVVDIRANNAPGAISLNNFKNFNQLLLAEDENIDFLKERTWDKKSTPKSQRHNRTWPDCISTLDGSVDTNRHYHIRLKGVPE